MSAAGKQEKGANIIMSLNEQQKLKERREESLTILRVFLVIADLELKKSRGVQEANPNDYEEAKRRQYESDEFAKAWQRSEDKNG